MRARRRCRRGEVDYSSFEFNREEPPAVARIRLNLANQFELPVFFYALVVLLVALGKVTMFDVIAAWVFVAGRVIHTLVQTLTDNVPLRGQVFMINAWRCWRWRRTSRCWRSKARPAVTAHYRNGYAFVSRTERLEPDPGPKSCVGRGLARQVDARESLGLVGQRQDHRRGRASPHRERTRAEILIALAEPELRLAGEVAAFGPHRDPDRRQRRPIRPIGHADVDQRRCAAGPGLASEARGLDVENVAEPDQRDRHHRGDVRRAARPNVAPRVSRCDKPLR